MGIFGKLWLSNKLKLRFDSSSPPESKRKTLGLNARLVEVEDWTRLTAGHRFLCHRRQGLGS